METSQFVQSYIKFLSEKGDPDESYKWDAISHFQENWNIEEENFERMFKNSFSKQFNLLFQNSFGFIKKAVEFFPEEVRAMFIVLYDESQELKERINHFTKSSEILLEKVKQKLDRDNLNAQQDERTLSVYLFFKFPEKYFLYKDSFYKKYCELINVQPKKAGNKFYHYLNLAENFKQKFVLGNQQLISKHRSIYPKTDWMDTNLMVQNILYIMIEKAKLTTLPITSENDERQAIPLNQILYGPPGTGKTYSTIDLAVQIAAPMEYVNGSHDENKETYDRLLKEKQIQFVTFHQSMSYEDFVEGIKPVLASNISDSESFSNDEKEELRYEIQDGIFKEIAENAENYESYSKESKQIQIEEGLIDDIKNKQFFKMSLGNSNDAADNVIYEYCIENDCIALGWGDANFSEYKSFQDLDKYFDDNGFSKRSYERFAVKCFKFWMNDNDLVFISDGNRKVRALAIINGS